MACVLWIHTHGLLGLHPADEVYRLPGSNTGTSQQAINAQSSSIGVERPKDALQSLRVRELFVEEYTDQGGPEETLELFYIEAAWAYRTLSLYTAAKSRDEQKLKEVLDIEGSAQRLPGIREKLECLL